MEGYADLHFEGHCMGQVTYAGSFGSAADDAFALLGQEAKAFVDVWHVKTAALEAELIEAWCGHSSSIPRSTTAMPRRSS